MRRLVVVGETALAAPGFLLDDFAGTSGRLDVLARSVRAALLISHGVRRDVVVDLVLLGGDEAPKVVRIDGATVKFLRPEERATAVLLQKVLRAPATEAFVEVRPGVSVARHGLAGALGDARDVFVLDEGGEDLRGVAVREGAVLVVGDHRGFSAASTAVLDARGARRVSVGPVSLHTEDAVTLAWGELDRRGG